MDSPGNFNADREFLSRHRDILQLQSGEAKILVCPSLQGRVFTSTAEGDNGFSFGWINYDLIASGKLLKHCNNWGGEDRFWLGPEGGQFSIFFPPGAKYDLSDWQTPAPIDSESWSLVTNDGRRAILHKSMELLNTSGNLLKTKATREITVYNEKEVKSELGIEVSEKVKTVGFQSVQ
ncbi:MAG: DUF6786 family protein [Cyclobacteriaceae bacterium]|nr:DUF6786 family protein [Cyclobacteriaceae bacterium]